MGGNNQNFLSAMMANINPNMATANISSGNFGERKKTSLLGEVPKDLPPNMAKGFGMNEEMGGGMNNMGG